MNELDAAEEMLAGEKYLDCPDCGGKGRTTVPAVGPPWSVWEDKSGSSYEEKNCERCRWTGKIPRREYVQAATALGVQPPEQPHTAQYALSKDMTMQIMGVEDKQILEILAESVKYG